ncbi:hypothetical protein [Jannaschia sp. CCS1]|uniref:hypothetical protein n=1 Tax=Jannaschia sp. (strain CCS1) TaxID=290400 RepID=UPI0002ECE988|nr:hypothetical protein [Jannaschia sp. CCS1]
MKDEIFQVGELTYRLQDGCLRSLSWKGFEAVRGLSAAIRDTAWGTLPEDAMPWHHETGPGRASHVRTFAVQDGAVTGKLRIAAHANGRLEADLSLTAHTEFRTNRAGFCLLHPLRGVVGQPFTATSPDGTDQNLMFPERISPGQPALNLAGLRHTVQGVDVDIAMEGEVFEMEDQRNWSDASFKTYCRPLSKPLPQVIAAGETIHQRVVIQLSGDPVDSTTPVDEQSTVTMPEVLIAVEPDWLPAGPLHGNAALVRWAPDAAWTAATLARLGTALGHRPLDLEIVIPEGSHPEDVVDGVAADLAEAGLTARHVIALPAAYLQSHQPTGPWPDGPTPEQARDAARAAFPHARIGTGMLTNFTELNRRPPDGGDYITHANSAIVHAADDGSVLETLEAIPDVCASAAAIAGDRPLRLGLMAIGMRSNPYGVGLVPNPGGARITMTDSDPRQSAPFAAAYATAVCALAARAGIEAVTLAAAAGPLGAEGRPIGRTIDALAALAGQKARITGTPPGPLRIEASGDVISLDAADAAPKLEGFSP